MAMYLVLLSVTVLLSSSIVDANIQCDWSAGLLSMQYFEQPLYHDNASRGSFQQRYQVMDQYYQDGGPLLFYAGPENAMQPWTALCLNLPNWAKALSGYIVSAEHRYFGESHPSKSSNESLSFDPLTIDNTLADYATLITNFTGVGGKLEGAPVFVFGGSYGGFLSMMMKVKFPSIVYGSIASAAPTYLLGSIPNHNTNLWYDTVANIYQNKNKDCAAGLSMAFEWVVKTGNLGTPDAYHSLQTNLSLCTAPSVYSMHRLLVYLQHATSIITQMNFPFPGATKVPYAFSNVCDVFEDAYAGHVPLSQALAHLLDISMNVSHAKPGNLTCFPWHDQHLRLSSLGTSRNPTVQVGEPDSIPSSILGPLLVYSQNYNGFHSSIAKSGLRDLNFEESWYYICCHEFIQPIAGGQNFYHFDHSYNASAVASYCQRRFPNMTQSVYPFHVSQLSNASNILFSNMGYDPVQAFSIQKSVSPSVSLMMIPNGGHTIDIIAPSTTPSDQPDVIAARQKELEILQQWLKQYYSTN